MCSKRNSKLTESDRGRKFCNNIFQNFPKNNIIKHYFRNTSLEAVYAERFNRTNTDLPKRPVFERGDSNWIDFLPTITKKFNIPVHTSTKLTPIQDSLKKNE